MKYSAEEGVLLCHVHRASVTEELLKYPGFTMPHYNIYMNKKSLWNSFSDGWKKNKKRDCG